MPATTCSQAALLSAQLAVSPFEMHGGSPGHALESIEASPDGPPHPKSYMDILDLLQEVSRVPEQQ